jgi:hypothetical protein
MMQYMIAPGGEAIYAVLQAGGAIIGHRKTTWEVARSTPPDGVDELTAGEPPGAEALIPWTFRDYGPLMHDQFGYVTLADLRKMDRDSDYWTAGGAIVRLTIQDGEPIAIEEVGRVVT